MEQGANGNCKLLKIATDTHGHTQKEAKKELLMKKYIILGMLCLSLLSVPTFLTPAALAEEQQDDIDKSRDYIIGSGDILDIITWKEEDLSREVAVRLDGKISFPMLDDIQAAGRSPMELKQDIQNRLKDFVEVPFVTVSVKKSNSQKFYILGEIMNAGEYPIVKNLTVLQAVALAGGFSEWASKNEILLFREENGTKKTILINYRNLVKKQDFSNNVQIQSDDTIIVP